MKYTSAPAPQEVIDFVKGKSLTPSFSYQDIWKEEHMTAFTVAKAMQYDILSDVRGAVLKSIEDGTTLREFQKELTPLLQKRGWWGKSVETDPLDGKRKKVTLGTPRRLKVIYDTNTRMAFTRGQCTRIQDTKETLPYLLYYVGPVKTEHRAEHLAWDGLCLPVDDPFWQTHMPINAYGCKCGVRQVSEAEYQELKARGEIITKAPDIKYREFINKRTGLVESIPVGIDPGFDYSPCDHAVYDKYGLLDDCDSRALNAFGKGACATKIPGQPTWQTLGLLSAKDIPEDMKLEAPAVLTKTADVRRALLGNDKFRVISSPVEDVVITSKLVNYLIKHNKDTERFKFANFIIPTLTNPNEVWLSQYTDGTYRPNYIAYFKDVKDMAVIVKLAKDGNIVWNAIPANDRYINNVRVGNLRYRK